MNTFSKKSRDKLNTCHPALIDLMEAVLKRVDITIIYGHRTVKEQQELFNIGRDKKGNVIGKTVTNADGTIKKSSHNYTPSLAVDVAPYPINWQDIASFKRMGAIIKEEASKLGVQIEWGGDWAMGDFPHVQLKKSVYLKDVK